MKNTVLFLPLTNEQVQSISVTNVQAELISTLETPQLAAITVIQNLPALITKPATQALIEAEKALSELISVGNELTQTHPPGTFAHLVSSRFNSNKFEAGLSFMPMIGIHLLDEEDVEAGDYLSGGAWDFEFCDRHKRTQNPLKFEYNNQLGQSFSLSDEQNRTFHIIQAEPDESIHIQGLAGTGKTHMIERLIASLSHCKPLMLAFTKPQLHALMARVGGSAAHLTGMTFGEVADYILRREIPRYRPGKRSTSLYRVAPAVIAKQLGYRPIGKLNSSEVASMCARMVSSFCYGSDKYLSDKHIPRGFTFSHIETAVLVEYARVFWEETISPSDVEFPLPLRGYHRIKHASLLPEAKIGDEFTHIIVDEAHDLSSPLADFLDRSHQPVITLGDAFQRMDGQYLPRAERLRKQQLTHSVRAGHRMEEVINPLIENHPVLKLETMRGNGSINTKVIYYDKPEIPYGEVTILVDSEWGMFEWFQRLSNAGAKFSFLFGASANFRRFMISCIDLFHDGIRPKHGALFKYTSWSALSRDMRKNPSFERVERMLSKGYSTVDLEASLLNLDETGNAKIRLGRVADARNMELDTVMLAPDLLSFDGKSNHVSASMAFSALYIGSSRARHQLIVPGYLRDWATEIGAKAHSGT